MYTYRMTSNKDIVTTPALSEHLIGRVKWFNNKTGYGFITVTDGEKSGTDIFVHHSSIQVVNQQYKYLLQGEYVEFDLLKTTSGKYEWQAVNVIGINSGKLMCETRFESKIARTNYKSTKPIEENDETLSQTQSSPEQQCQTKTIDIQDSLEQAPSQRKTRQASKPKVRGGGPREGESSVWKLVEKTSKGKASQSKQIS